LADSPNQNDKAPSKRGLVEVSVLLQSNQHLLNKLAESLAEVKRAAAKEVI